MATIREKIEPKFACRHKDDINKAEYRWCLLVDDACDGSIVVLLLVYDRESLSENRFS